MTEELTGCRVHFPAAYDDRGEWEVEAKGYLQGVEVELADGGRYPLFFYDPVRLAQDLEADAKFGRTVMAEPGMVVVTEVTRPAILRAVGELVGNHFFDHLRPMARVHANGAAR